MLPNSRSFLALPFSLSIVGILFALWNIWGDASVLCITEGCSLFQGFSIGGVSLWWIGLVGFSFLLFPAVLGSASVGMFMAGAGLLLDIGLLLIMLFTAPCFNCMIIALILALTYLSFRYAANEGRRRPRGFSWLLGLWGLLLLLNLGGMAQGLSSLWAVDQPAEGQADVHVYFSPSCPACRELVRSMPEKQSAAWYPVAENDADLLIIADLAARRDKGVPFKKAFEEALAAAPELVRPGDVLRLSVLRLQISLWRNRAHVLEAGSPRLPFVEYWGVPAQLTSQNSSAAPAASTPSSPAPAYTFDPLGRSSTDLPFLGVSNFCEDNKPCDPPAPR